MTEPAMPEEKAAADPLAEAYRREKRAFWWSCGCVGGIIFSEIIRAVCVFCRDWQLKRMVLAGVPVHKVLRIMEEFPLWAYFTIGLLVVSLLGLALSLGLWLRAIHERRRIEAKQFLPPRS